MPEDWPADKVYEIQDGILLKFGKGYYYMYVAKGNGRNKTFYEFAGDLTLDLDAQGRLTGGTGKGKGTISFPDGSSRKGVPDTLTFKVTAVREPKWCAETR